MDLFRIFRRKKKQEEIPKQITQDEAYEKFKDWYGPERAEKLIERLNKFRIGHQSYMMLIKEIDAKLRDKFDSFDKDAAVRMAYDFILFMKRQYRLYKRELDGLDKEEVARRKAENDFKSLWGLFLHDSMFYPATYLREHHTMQPDSPYFFHTVMSVFFALRKEFVPPDPLPETNRYPIADMEQFQVPLFFKAVEEYERRGPFLKEIKPEDVEFSEELKEWVSSNKHLSFKTLYDRHLDEAETMMSLNNFKIVIENDE